MENNTIIRVVDAVVYNVKDGVADEATYRVSLTEPFNDYRKDKDGNRVERDVISFLMPRNVLLAQILNKLPRLARMYDIEKKKFESLDENKGKIMPFVDQLTTYLKGGEITLNIEYHAAGEMYKAADGSEKAYTVDQNNIKITDIKYGTIGAAVVAQLDAAEEAAEVKRAMALFGLS